MMNKTNNYLTLFGTYFGDIIASGMEARCVALFFLNLALTKKNVMLNSYKKIGSGIAIKMLKNYKNDLQLFCVRFCLLHAVSFQNKSL